MALTGLEVSGRVLESQAARAEEKPFEFAGEIGGEAVVGGAAFKAVEKAGDVSRGARLSNKDTVELEDITSERGAEGDLPRFDTDPDADTAKAVDEIETRAQDNPDVVTEKTGGDSTLFHGTQTDFGDSIEVGEGASELPGLFTSPDASPIALADTGTSLSLPSIKPRLPDTSGKSDRFAGLPGDDVDAIPEGRGSAGYELRDIDTGEQIEGGLGRGEAKAAADTLDDAEVRPDQTASGYDFLTEDADAGTAYVRPSGQRTTELESIFPPDSAFQRTGQVNVRVDREQIPGTDVDVPFSGRSVPLDTYRRVDSDAPDVDSDLDGPSMSDGDGDIVDYDELRSSLRDSRSRPEGSPTVGGGLAGAGAGVFTGSGGFDTDMPESSSPGTPTFDSPFGGDGATGGPTAPPSDTTPPISVPPASTPPVSTPPASTPPTTPSGGGPTSGSPFPTGGSPTGGSTPGFPTQTTPAPRFDLGGDQDDEELEIIESFETVQFENPYATAGEALFGGEGLFGGGEDAQ